MAAIVESLRRRYGRHAAGADAMLGVVCQMIGHRRDAAHVWDDGHTYRAPCRRCGLPMIKVHLGDWRAFDAERDHDPDGMPRKGRPAHR